MGTLTVAEFRVEIRAGLGGRQDLNDRLLSFLNLAHQRLARMHDFEEMKRLSDSSMLNTGSEQDRFITLPNLREVYSIVLVSGSDSRKLVGRTSAYMDALAADPTYYTRGVPNQYCVWGDVVEIFQLPQQDYPIRMRWTQWPATLVDETDKSEFNQKDDILIELAIAHANFSLGKEEDGAKHERRALVLLNEATEIDRKRPDITLTPRPSDGQLVGAAVPADYWNDPFRRE